MKKNSTSNKGLFNSRGLFALALCSAGLVLAILSFAGVPSLRVAAVDERPRYIPVAGEKGEDLDRMEVEWFNRVTYPTGIFNPEWLKRGYRGRW